ncbi:MAG TPA: ABC transporter permease, partial [Casimicrobiaceae bacterium]
MTTSTGETSVPLHETPIAGVTTVVDRKAPVLLSVLALGLLLIIAIWPEDGDTTFRLAVPSDFAQLPTVTVPSTLTAWIMVVVCALCAAWSILLYRSRRRTPMWLVILYSVAWMIGFLTWAATGGTVPVVGLLSGSLALAVPLVFGALGGVLGERSGVVNIAIDGQLLAGAFAAAMIGSALDSTWAGLLAAMAAGALVALILGLFAISYFVDQIIVGVVLNVLVIGLTSFMFTQVLAPNAASLNSPPRFERIAIPVLGDIPLIGPVFFRQTAIVYLLYIAVAVVTFALYRTRWGLRVRAVGEHPMAADTVGIKVNRTRYRTILIAGAVAGMGGAFYTLVSVPQFNREMTGGAGYIALA